MMTKKPYTPPQIFRVELNQQQAILAESHLSSNEVHQIIAGRGTNWMTTIEKVEPVLAIHPPIWPVALIVCAIVAVLLWYLLHSR